MRVNFLNFLSVASVALFNVKKAFASDNFLEGVDRPEFFQMTDFKIPTIRVNLPEDEFELFITGNECNRDCNPSFLRRNDKCYTASWVDLNKALDIGINKKYIDIEAIKKNVEDYKFVQSVIELKTHDITLEEFERLVKNYSDLSLEKIMSINYGLYQFPEPNLNSKNASMTFELDGVVEKVKKVKISIGGRSTRAYSKLGYNINIKDENAFHGVKQLRLRSEVVDPTFIRDKLGYDLYGIIDLPTLSANYCKFYLNDHFMGLFLVRDAFKPYWVERTFGEKDTTHLYSCDGSYGTSVYFNCRNDEHEDDKNYVDPDWEDFLKKLEQSKTREDLEKFFDVETYIKWQVSRYVFGSWDHVSRTHNNVVYMFHDTRNNKDFWIPLLYDFDLNFGSRNIVNATRTFKEEVENKETVNPLYKILNINEDSKEVRDILQEIFEKAFDPRKILARIDQLKSFLSPYVLEDRTPDENGNRPGRVDRVLSNAEDLFSYEDFLENSEFTTVKTTYNGYTGFTYGALKGWIIERFKFACKHYDLDCSFAGDFLESPFVTSYEAKSKEIVVEPSGCKGTGYSCCIFEDTPINTKDKDGYWGLEGGKWCLFENNPMEGKKYDDMDPEKCWSDAQGYPCCKNPKTTIANIDSNNYFWGIEDGKWCGITGVQCPAYSNIYKCCTVCKVKFTDKDGDWGVENGQWCSIPYSCRSS